MRFWTGEKLEVLRRWYDENYTLDFFESKIAEGRCFVAVDNFTGEVVGTVMILEPAIIDGVLSVEMYCLYVDVRGQGIGSMLIEAVKDVCVLFWVLKVYAVLHGMGIFLHKISWR